MTAEAAARMEMKVFIVSLVSSYREIFPVRKIYGGFVRSEWRC